MAHTAILFDLDETLLADIDSTDRALTAASALAHTRYAIAPTALVTAVKHHAHVLWNAAPTHPYCQNIGISSWEGLWGTFVGADPGLQALAAWMPDYQLAVWQHALADFDVTDDALAAALMQTFQQQRRATFVLFAETLTVLQRLRGTYRLAIVTNGAPDVQRTKVAGAQLAPYFDAVVVSGEVGVGKPDARVFQRALDALAVPAAQAVMVGDNILRDIGGGQRLGLLGVWVNRHEAATTASGVVPDHTITTLDALESVLAR